MRDYTVTFIEPVELETLATAAAESFAMPRERIEVWDGEDFAGQVIEPVLAQVAAGSGPDAFAEFVGFDAFAHHTGAPDHLTVALATRNDLTYSRDKTYIDDQAAAAPQLFRWSRLAHRGYRLTRWPAAVQHLLSTRR